MLLERSTKQKGSEHSSKEGPVSLPVPFFLIGCDFFLQLLIFFFFFIFLGYQLVCSDPLHSLVSLCSHMKFCNESSM